MRSKRGTLAHIPRSTPMSRFSISVNFVSPSSRLRCHYPDTVCGARCCIRLETRYTVTKTFHSLKSTVDVNWHGVEISVCFLNVFLISGPTFSSSTPRECIIDHMGLQQNLVLRCTTISVLRYGRYSQIGKEKKINVDFGYRHTGTTGDATSLDIFLKRRSRQKITMSHVF